MVKIYCIEDINNLKYVGSTKRELKTRLAEHKNDRKNKNCSSKKVDLDNCEIKLLEECEDNIRKEREAYWIDKIDCVNKMTYDFDKKQYQRNLHHYKKSWGGNKRWNNNLLQINVDLFTS